MKRVHDSSPAPLERQQFVFWGCFIALVTTSFAFFTRMYLCDVRFGTDFGIDKVGIGALKGAGVWPFAISIILFSLVIDRIGYKVAMLFSFLCYVVYLVMAWMAYGTIQGVAPEQLSAAQARGYQLLYWGSIVLGLGNGTVEAFINPVVATMFNREKTKWLNILHAGWPGGLVIAGIITIMLAETARSGDWRIVLGIVAVPAVIYLLMLAGVRFPRSEREQAGVSYREMLAEFGAFGALVGFGLIFLQLAEVFQFNVWIAVALAAAVAVAFGIYTGSFGRSILALLIVIMMPLATTEIGTDGWISGLMERPMEAAGFNPGWVLHVGDHDGPPVLRRPHRAQPVSHRPARRQFGDGDPGPARPVEDRQRGAGGDLRRGHALRHRQDLFLADHAGRGGGAVPQGWRPDPERDFRDRHDRGGGARIPAHRSPAGTDGQRRTAAHVS
jgi:MFS family permease